MTVLSLLLISIFVTVLAYIFIATFISILTFVIIGFSSFLLLTLIASILVTFHEAIIFVVIISIVVVLFVIKYSFILLSSSLTLNLFAESHTFVLISPPIAQLSISLIAVFIQSCAVIIGFFLKLLIFMLFQVTFFFTLSFCSVCLIRSIKLCLILVILLLLFSCQVMGSSTIFLPVVFIIVCFGFFSQKF